MLEALKKMMGIAPKADLAEVLSRGGVIVDVRTPGEFAGGHLKNSINIPLQNLQGSLSKLKKDKPVITCCASGMRSSSARSMLLAQGFTEVHNGGSWFALKKYEQ